MRIAYGPISLNGKDDWPLNRVPELRDDGFHIIPFEKEPPTEADVICWHSPEYHPFTQSFLTHKAYRVGIVGDHHVVPFEHISYLSDLDLIATDYRGTKRLAELGYPTEKTLYYRMFSWDRRLHVPPEYDRRDIAVSFLGRPVAERHPYLLRIVEWGKKTGHPVYVTTDPYERGKEAHYYRRSKVVWHMSQRGELSMRPYEAAACGALAMTELANDELYQANAPLVGWNDSLLEEQLTEWVTNDAAREAKVKAQWEWAQRETPARHLRYLCEQIRERMAHGREEKVQAQRSQVAQGSIRGDVGGSGGRQSVPTVREGERLGVDYSQIDPPEGEMRPEIRALVPQSARKVLDIGTFQGALPLALKRERPGIYVVGVDNDPRSEERCKVRMDEFYAFDLARYDTYNLQPWSKHTYDCIIAADVLEHLWNPYATLAHLRPMLAHDGVLVASIPQIRNVANLHALIVQGRWEHYIHGAHADSEWEGPHMNVWAFDHIKVFTKKTIEQMFTQTGYVIERWEQSQMSAPGLEQFADDLAFLCATHGGDAEALKAHLYTIQHLVVARPKWDVLAKYVPLRPIGLT